MLRFSTIFVGRIYVCLGLMSLELRCESSRTYQKQNTEVSEIEKVAEFKIRNHFKR